MIIVVATLFLAYIYNQIFGMDTIVPKTRVICQSGRKRGSISTFFGLEPLGFAGKWSSI